MNYSLHREGALAIQHLSGSCNHSYPARLDVQLSPVDYSYAHIDVVVQDLTFAGLEWRGVSLEKRFEKLKIFFDQLLLEKDIWMRCSRAETARSRGDLDQEWQCLAAWIRDFFQSPDYVRGQVGTPRGLTAIIGSSVWPLYYGTRDLALSLLAGNPTVIRPSEQVTRALSEFYLHLRSKMPSLNPCWSLIPGDREMARRLSLHSDVQVVIFRGSFETGMRLRQDTLGQPNKLVLLYLGSKNSAWIRNLSAPKMIPSLIRDCFLASGQHCRSVSNIWVAAPYFDSFLDQFHEEAKRFKIISDDPDAFAGPMLDSSSLDRYLKFSGIAEREGAELLMRGKPLEQAGQSLFVTPTLAVFRETSLAMFKKSVALQTEILAPHVNIVKWDTTLAPTEWSKWDAHGHLVSVWNSDATESDLEMDQLALDYGQVYLNQSVWKMGPHDIYQVRKKSGNEAFHGLEILTQLTRRSQQKR
jgi:acyl-CoA reductase-like NAD-dependent aldehyde dehydrogenase